MALSMVTYTVPQDVDQRILEWRERLAARRGVEAREISKAGETLRELLALAEAAELLGIQPAPKTAQA